MKVGTVLTNNKWLTQSEELTTRYNSWDCINTAKLIPKIKANLRASGNEPFFEKSLWPLVPVVNSMQALGVGYLDKPRRNEMRSRLRKEISQPEESILDGTTKSTYTAKLFNSPKQRAKLLFDDWGLPVAKPTRNRRSRSTDQAALIWTLNHLRKKDEPYRHKLHDLFHRSRIQTILERYLVIEGDPDGRVRPTIKLTGTETGRFAYAGGPGEAIQQWPPECRKLIRAREGYVFVSADYSQLEARILAVLSQDQLSLQAFASGRDAHTQNCMDLFGFTETDYENLDSVRKTALRNYAKTFLYGLSYGGKPDSIEMKLFCPCFRCVANAPPQVNLSKAEVGAAAGRWMQAHSPIMDWRARLVESVYGVGGDRTWTSPFGYRRRFWEPQDIGERSLMNYPMQHCASQIINRAMVELHKLGWPISLQMHDELVLEVSKDLVGASLSILKIVMEAPVPELDDTIFPVSTHVGETWADLK